jgi:hypothetical protein
MRTWLPTAAPFGRTAALTLRTSSKNDRSDRRWLPLPAQSDNFDNFDELTQVVLNWLVSDDTLRPRPPSGVEAKPTESRRTGLRSHPAASPNEASANAPIHQGDLASPNPAWPVPSSATLALRTSPLCRLDPTQAIRPVTLDPRTGLRVVDESIKEPEPHTRVNTIKMRVNKSLMKSLQRTTTLDRSKVSLEFVERDVDVLQKICKN